MARVILFFFGPPGSGKGTQSAKLSQQFALPAISTGNLLRQHYQLTGERNIAINKGQLVNDQLINNLLVERLQQPDTHNGFILDGYPRNKTQFDYFYNNLITPDDQVYAIEISVSDQEVQDRIAGRRFCPQCGAGYHLIYQPSQQADRCDNCQAILEQRSDDNPETVKERLALYRSTMGPLVVAWWQLGELIIINGEKDIDSVYHDILVALQERGLTPTKPATI